MSDDTITGDVLDAIEAELHRRYRKRKAGTFSRAEQAITSDELAAEIVDEHTDANPKTREAVKIVMRTRSIPIIGDHDGYRIPLDREPIDDAVDSLEGRIEGIRERQQLLEDTADEFFQRADGDGYYGRLTAEEQSFVDDTGFSAEEVWEQRHGGEE